MCERCSKLTRKTPEQHHLRWPGFFIASFKQVSHIVLLFSQAHPPSHPFLLERETQSHILKRRGSERVAAPHICLGASMFLVKKYLNAVWL